MAIASGFHLFPFRTEKLSPTAPMVLPRWESRSLPFFKRVPFWRNLERDFCVLEVQEFRSKGVETIVLLAFIRLFVETLKRLTLNLES